MWIGDGHALRRGRCSPPTRARPTRSSRRCAVATEADVDPALDRAAAASRRGAARRGAARRGPHRAPRSWLRERRLEITALEVREAGQAVARGRRRRVRGDRLPRVLRARRRRAGGAPGRLRSPARPAPAARRAQRAALEPARRRRRHLAVELPGGDPAGDGQRRPGDGQRRDPQAGRADAGVRSTWSRGAARVRAAADALSFLPGEGDVGAQLVADPRVHTIAFTGSNTVGLEIVRRPPTRRRARTTSSASSPRWAARTA